MSDLTKSKWNKEFIRNLLTNDALDRKYRSWKILDRKDMTHVWNNSSFDRVPLRRVEDDEVGVGAGKDRFKDVFVYEKDLNRGISHRAYWNDQEQDMIGDINEKFPFTRELLQKFHGKIYACGGSIFKSMFDETYRDSKGDIDFFFVRGGVDGICNYASSDTSECTKTLLEALAYLCGLWQDRGHDVKGDDDDHHYPLPDLTNRNNLKKHILIISRNQYVVTLYVIKLDHSICHSYIKYQFILRVYPSLGSILGGFDLGPSMIAYDGHHILSTLFGAWSAFNRTIIVDTTRRSTTYERRIQKYSHHCHVVFPGLKVDLVKDVMSEGITKDKMIRLVLKELMENGYLWEDGDFVKENRPEVASERMVCDALHDLADQFDYDIDRLEIRPRKPVVKDMITKEEMKRKVDGVLRKNGYYWHNKWSHYHMDADKKESKIGEHFELADIQIRLPHISFLFESTGRPKNYNSFHSGHRCPQKVDGGNGQKEKTKQLQGSDYEDIGTHPFYLADMNATNLRLNKLDAVCAFMTILPKDLSFEKVLGFMGDNGGNVNIMSAALNTMMGDSSCVPSDCMFDNIKARLFDGLGHVATSVMSDKHVLWLGREEKFVMPKAEILDIRRERARPWSPNRPVPNGGINGVFRKRFAEFGDEILNGLRKAIPEEDQVRADYGHIRYECVPGLKDALGEMDRRMKENAEKVQEMLSCHPVEVCLSGEKSSREPVTTKLRWITDNPGRQWTSSINPIMADPRDWYGGYYQSFRIGDHGLELSLRVLRNKRNRIMKLLNKDLFEMLLREILYTDFLTSLSLMDLFGEAIFSK